jgi:hypothetical protein
MSAKNKVRKVDFSPDEFLVGIAGMKAIDIAVYWVACSLQMSSGRSVNINDSRLYSIIDARRPDILAALARLVAASKLHRNGDELENNRVRKEIKSAVNRIRTARKNGAKGGRHPKKINELENPPGSDVGSQPEKLSPPPSPSPPSVGKEESSSNDGGEGPPLGASQSPPNVIQTPRAVLFSSCREYLERSGMTEDNARSLLAKWAKKYGDGVVIDVVSSCMTEERVDPKSWITAALKARHETTSARRVHGV